MSYKNKLFPQEERIRKLKSSIKEMKKLDKLNNPKLYGSIIRDFKAQLNELKQLVINNIHSNMSKAGKNDTAL